MTHWIVIADASGARAVSLETIKGPLTVARQFPNPKGRKRSGELDADQPGRVSKAGAPGTRSAMQPHTTAHDEAALDFARQLAAALRAELDRGAFTSLSLVAPPHFLGVLRSALDARVRQAVQGTLDRDLVHVDLDGLKPHVERLLTHDVSA
jgi:protein required for attachment to host cells